MHSTPPATEDAQEAARAKAPHIADMLRGAQGLPVGSRVPLPSLGGMLPGMQPIQVRASLTASSHTHVATTQAAPVRDDNGLPGWPAIAPAQPPAMGVNDLAAAIRERLAEQQRAMQPQPVQPAMGAPLGGLLGGGVPVDVLARLLESQRAAEVRAPALGGNQMAMQLLGLMQQQQGQQQGR